MNLQETANVLGFAQAFDNRTVGEANVRAWHYSLRGLNSGDVLEAIRRHYATETAWIMPAHINRLVDEIARERESAANPWAPGQHGVPKEQALPELPRSERLTAGDISPRIVELLSQLRAELPDAPREKLFPRQEAWKREQAAFRRAEDATPNPHYRPGGPVDRIGQLAETYREKCRAAGAHDDGVHIDACPETYPPLQPDGYDAPGCRSAWHAQGPDVARPVTCLECGAAA